MSHPVLAIADAYHRYGSTVALAGVRMTVRAGECVALLGPNGAGKSTLIGLATGLLAPQGSTDVRVLDGDPCLAATRRRLGVVQQSIGFPRTLTVRELVRAAAVRAGLTTSAADRVLVETGLAELSRRRAVKLSGGQQQRLALAMALVADPALMLLDEPTVGLDIAARRIFWRTLARRRDQGAGVLLTTHGIEEAAAVADRVVLLHRGRVVAEGTPEDLASRLPDRTVTLRTWLTATEVAAFDGVTAAIEREGLVRVSTDQPERVLQRLFARDPDLSDLRVEGASLEQALVVITGADEEGQAA